MKKYENKLIPYSETLARLMLDPEFRKAYEADDEEDIAMRAYMDAYLLKKRLREEKATAARSTNFAA